MDDRSLTALRWVRDNVSRPEVEAGEQAIRHLRAGLKGAWRSNGQRRHSYTADELMVFRRLEAARRLTDAVNAFLAIVDDT